jgi:hypothetical protein
MIKLENQLNGKNVDGSMLQKIDITFSHNPPSIGLSTLCIVTIITILFDFQSPRPLVRAI